MLACALPGAAVADDENDLATSIKNTFYSNGALYRDGQLGNDWCFNVETERGYSWWYSKIGNATALQATKVINMVRIQATYMDYDTNTPIFRKYASVILGLDTSGAKLPVNSTLSRTPPPTLKTANVSPVSGALQEPPTANTQCQTLGAFLKAYVLPFALSAVTATPTLDSDSMNYKTGARYWMFNGRGHAVLGIGSYPITLQDPDDAMVTYKVNLIVGYGGGAGP
jgi:hypothetical protein